MVVADPRPRPLLGVDPRSIEAPAPRIPAIDKRQVSGVRLLIVAVSRAQERLCVVGDAAAWSTVPHLSILRGQLRVVRPAERLH